MISLRAIKVIVHYTLSRIFSIINSVIPKDERVIMFISKPDFSDNPRYLYERLKETKVRYRFVWVVADKSKFEDLRSDSTSFVQYRTLKYLRWILKAKYLVLSHGVPYWKSKNQIALLLWHGIPLKAMGFSLRLRRSKLESLGEITIRLADYFILPSKMSWILLSSEWTTCPRNILYLGQPRCDALFTPKENSLETLSEILNYPVETYDRIAMYLPTFRDYSETATREIISSLISNMEFRRFLKNQNVLFIIKPHIKDEAFFEKYGSNNIRILKNSELVDRYLTIYDILPAVDVLITDYSSVYFDYLLLNRPIVFYAPDLKKYRETRGFLLEPYEKWTPGDKARNVEELVKALEEAIENPKKWERERLWLRDVMFKYQDGKASERIIKYFWGDV